MSLVVEQRSYTKIAARDQLDQKAFWTYSFIRWLIVS